MQRFFSHRSLYVYITGAVALGVVFLIVSVVTRTDSPRVVTTVESGTVRQVVSVTGAIRAENTAELGFPAPGIVDSVHVRKGDVVATGTKLVALDTDALTADVAEARSELRSAEADLAELRAGVRVEQQVSSAAAVALKQQALERTIIDGQRTVDSAQRTLLSSDLIAVTTNADEDAPAPIISGTFLCDQPGTYTLTVFSSQSPSGYSLRLSGLESGTFVAASEQSAPFGTCGLRAQFTPGANYHNSVWTISIPNQLSPEFTTNRNAYEAAVTQTETAIALAEQELTTAEADAILTTAPTRIEAIARAEAAVARAAARLARTEATLRDSQLTAPFAGTVVRVDAVAGETVGTVPVVTLLSTERYELIARIPEIDVGKLALGQTAEVVFDTAVTETQTATIDFISPEATVIDGVAYYEARLELTTLPPWLRSGLNADIDIIIAEETGLRLPRRFVSQTEESASVLIANGNSIATSTIEVSLVGNDGFVAIRGIPAGTTVVAP
jgi:HlyD family secretion protein